MAVCDVCSNLSKIKFLTDSCDNELKAKANEVGVDVNNKTILEIINEIELNFVENLPKPLLNFRGKDIIELSQFNDTASNVSVNWSGSPTIENNGVKTTSGKYGTFTYDFSPFDEFTMVYTVTLLERGHWVALLNLGRASNTYGLKVEHNANQNYTSNVQLEGVNQRSSDANSLVPVIGSAVSTQMTIAQNRPYNIALRVSLTNGVDAYLNGVLVHHFEQPEDLKGFNPNNWTNIRNNAFNRRLSNNDSNISSIHHSLRIWNVALNDARLQEEINQDIVDYGIEVANV